MRRIFLTACAAALAISSACEKKSTPTPTSKSTLAPVAVVTPVIPSIPEVTPQTPVEPKDELALPSEGSATVDHLARARQLQTDGDLPGALIEARRALSENATDEDALTLVGRLGRSTRDFKLAAAAYGRLATVTPEDAMPLVQQARLLLRAGMSQEALEVAQKAAERDAEDPEVHQAWGRALFSQGKLDGAISQFERVVELAPDHGYALNNLGLAYLHTNQNSKAVLVLARAAQLLPDVAYVMNNYGVALERTGQVDDARMAYYQAMDLSPKYVKALVNAQRLKKVASAGTPADSLLDESEAPIDSEP